tara:strand:+ start:238 stop:558 length:321 start_codon:yes stop_codon:yes gene_type:complete
MNYLIFDIIRSMADFLKFQDILNFSMTCKNTQEAFDKIFYKNLAYKFYGRCFRLKASCRPVRRSKPLKNFKLEIIRIENFMRNLDNLNATRWTKKDFYNYWKYDMV